MNKQLLKFIELCLTDGVITDKEREVIFRKATEYNVDIDECEIILESMIQQKNMSQTSTVSKNEIVTEVNTEINNSEKDSFFREAAELIVEYQEVSEDFLKDKLKLGTNRACRLIEQLETTGLIDKINENNEYKINIRNGVFLEHFLSSGEIKKIYDYSFKNLTLSEKSNGAKIPNFNQDGYKYNFDLGVKFVELNVHDEEFADIIFNPKVANGFKGIEEFFKEIKPKDDYIQFFEKLFAFGTSYKKIKKYPNGDFFLGKIVDEKANGFGELTITSNDLFSNKKTKYIGHFFNDTFLEGIIICYESDEVKHIALQNVYDFTEYRFVRLLNNKYLCSSIYYPNGDNFEGDVVNFKRHGKGKLTKADGGVIEGNWENDTIIKEQTDTLNSNSENDNVIKDKRTVGSVRIEYKNSINQLYSDKKYQEVINEAELAEIGDDDFFKDSFIADKYLWSLMVRDLNKAYKEIDRITNITSDKSKIQDSVGMIYAKKGEENNDLNLLKKALQCFQSYDYSDKEFGTNRINNVQEKINILSIQNKLKSLGINSILEEQFKNGNYTKLWKVNCFVNEPYYWNKKIDKWKTSNPVFYLPSNGIITEKGAIAFIKAKWEDIYTYTIKNSSWKKEGGKELDKTKIEIIEINEII